MTSGGNQTARDGVDTRNKDLTGAGVVKVIPELASNASSAAGGGELEVKRFWLNGQLKYHKKEDGSVEEFDQKGCMLYRELPDGTVEEYTSIEVKYRSVMTYKKLPDGVIEKYSLSFAAVKERLYPDGSYERYSEDGSILLERKLSDGTIEHYTVFPRQRCSKLRWKELPDGSCVTYNKDGSIHDSIKDRELLHDALPEWN